MYGPTAVGRTGPAQIRDVDVHFRVKGDGRTVPGSEASLQDYRKDIVIELYNEAGQLAMAFKFYRCWPSKYSALTGFDAMSPDVALEVLVLEHEGWERDVKVTEPSEPSFTEPY